MSDTKVLSTKTVFTSKYFKVIKKVIKRNGKLFTKDIIERASSVLVIPYTAKQEIYITSEFRDAFNRMKLELVGGKIEGDINPLVAAKRELQEEAGLIAKTWKKLFEWELNPTMNSKIYLFAATDLEKGEQHLDSDEEINITKIPLEKVLKKIEDGEIDITEEIAAILIFDRLLKEGEIII